MYHCNYKCGGLFQCPMLQSLFWCVLGSEWCFLKGKFQGIDCPCSSKGAQCSQECSSAQFSCPMTIAIFPQFVPTVQFDFWPKFRSSNDLGFSADMIGFSPQFVRIIGDDAILHFLLLLHSSLCYVVHLEYVIEVISCCSIQYRSADRSSCCLTMQHWVSSFCTWLASMIVMPSLPQLAQYGLPATSPTVLSSSSQLVSNLALQFSTLGLEYAVILVVFTVWHSYLASPSREMPILIVAKIFSWVCKPEFFFPGIVPP